MEVKQIAGNMNRTKLSTNNFVTEEKIMDNFVNGYTMTNYYIFKAMYQMMDYDLCLEREGALWI